MVTWVAGFPDTALRADRFCTNGEVPTETPKNEDGSTDDILFGHGEKPVGSMYGIFTDIYHKNQPNVGTYTIHGW